MEDDRRKLVAPHDLSCQVGLACHEGVAKFCGALPRMSSSISAGADLVEMYLSSLRRVKCALLGDNHAGWEL